MILISKVVKHFILTKKKQHYVSLFLQQLRTVLFSTLIILCCTSKAMHCYSTQYNYFAFLAHRS